MKLLEEDEEYLNSKQFNWEFVPGNNEGYLIIKDYPLNSTQYQISKTDLMIRVPNGYNIANLDCFYTDPPVKLLDGAFPNAANQIVNFNNRQWQQFSRHFNSNWKPGIDGIQSMLTWVSKDLQS